ncbi:MAG: hypothetical protein HN842_07195, partial [Gammaproteobacteria bacterium]|nr:hypothetical protein [Gammaproteobacteria bacterium]
MPPSLVACPSSALHGPPFSGDPAGDGPLVDYFPSLAQRSPSQQEACRHPSVPCGKALTLGLDLDMIEAPLLAAWDQAPHPRPSLASFISNWLATWDPEVLFILAPLGLSGYYNTQTDGACGPCVLAQLQHACDPSSLDPGYGIRRSDPTFGSSFAPLLAHWLSVLNQNPTLMSPESNFTLDELTETLALWLAETNGGPMVENTSWFPLELVEVIAYSITPHVLVWSASDSTSRSFRLRVNKSNSLSPALLCDLMSPLPPAARLHQLCHGSHHFWTIDPVAPGFLDSLPQAWCSLLTQTASALMTRRGTRPFPLPMPLPDVPPLCPQSEQVRSWFPVPTATLSAARYPRRSLRSRTPALPLSTEVLDMRPIVLAVGFLELSDSRMFLLDGHPDEAMRDPSYRDTLRIRHLREILGPSVLLLALCVDPGEIPMAPTCFHLAYQKDMVLDSIRSCGFAGPVALVYIEYSHRMLLDQYFRNSFGSDLLPLLSQPNEIRADVEVWIPALPAAVELLSSRPSGGPAVHLRSTLADEYPLVHATRRTGLTSGYEPPKDGFICVTLSASPSPAESVPSQLEPLSTPVISSVTAPA